MPFAKPTRETDERGPAAAMKRAFVIGVPVLAGLVALGIALFTRHLRDAPATPLVLRPDLVVQDGQTRVSTTGFFPEEAVQISVKATSSSASSPIRDVQAGVDGTIDAASVVLPDSLPSGEHELIATGMISGRRSRATVFVRAPSPWLTLESGDLKPRAPVGVIVGGFATNEPVAISIRPVPPSKSSPSPVPTESPRQLGVLSTDRVGNSRFTRFLIPYRDAGDVEIIAKGTSSLQEVKKSITLTPYQPTFDLSPWSGPPGLRFQLNARGYAPDESVDIYLGASAKPAATVVADQYGNFWGAGDVPVPYAAFSGPLDVRAVGRDSGASTTRQFSVQRPKPWLELTSYAGAPSAPVEFSGGGWAAGERVSFHLNTALSPAVIYGQADAYGWLHDAGPLYIPKDASNKLTIVAVGDSSHAWATATFTVVLPFGLRPE
jgi:hypothetical protein